ncbi:hypothetical protein AB0M94_23445 [Streptomyces xanthochromogenes]|uniref:Uncharacterized protein n=1 Tax=Streptomyces xanthochromogenes TaxID=67384 RepID=A0ABQ3AK14_9ACTN|nr:hypothetical protein [Streptomyces xanthochromogenes]GGY58928.1 hypothetical protein GCM10010326_62050 [Streptomyces xanthochromogenes]
MPGQRKRKRQRERAARSRSPQAGRWEQVFSTQDEAELRAETQRLYAEGELTDPSMLRVDMLCGRLRSPTTYRLSLFVPDASA